MEDELTRNFAIITGMAVMLFVFIYSVLPKVENEKRNKSPRGCAFLPEVIVVALIMILLLGWLIARSM